MQGILTPLARSKRDTNLAGGLLPDTKAPRTWSERAVSDKLDGQVARNGSGTGTVRRKFNQRISLKVRARMFSLNELEDYTADVQRGNALFVLRGMRPMSRPAEHRAMLSGDKTAFTRLGQNVPACATHVLNFMMAKMTVDAPDEMPDGPSPDWFMQNVRLIGIVVTSNHAAQYSTACREFAVDYQSYITQATSMWTPIVRFCDKLMAVIERRRVTQKQRYYTMSNVQTAEHLEVRNRHNKVIKYVTQVVPIVSATGYISPERLLTRIDEDDGVPRYEQAHQIRFGLVFQGMAHSAMTPEFTELARQRYYGNGDAMIHADACVDAIKAKDYGHIEMMVDPAC